MPSCQGHILGGIAAFAITATIAPTYCLPHKMTGLVFLSELSICVVGALFPDIDTKSVVRRYFYFALTTLITIALMQRSYSSLFYFATVGLFPFLTVHRGITHNPLFLIIGPAALLRITSFNSRWAAIGQLHYYIFFVAGAISHILLDFAPFGLFRSQTWKKKKARLH